MSEGLQHSQTQLEAEVEWWRDASDERQAELTRLRQVVDKARDCLDAAFRADRFSDAWDNAKRAQRFLDEVRKKR